jgi:hypothetical protein
VVLLRVDKEDEVDREVEADRGAVLPGHNTFVRMQTQNSETKKRS